MDKANFNLHRTIRTMMTGNALPIITEEEVM